MWRLAGCACIFARLKYWMFRLMLFALQWLIRERNRLTACRPDHKYPSLSIICFASFRNVAHRINCSLYRRTWSVNVLVYQLGQVAVPCMFCSALLLLEYPFLLFSIEILLFLLIRKSQKWTINHKRLFFFFFFWGAVHLWWCWNLPVVQASPLLAESLYDVRVQ